MTLQLSSLLDMSSDKHVSIWNYGFSEKKPPKLNVKLTKNYVCSIGEKIS